MHCLARTIVAMMVIAFVALSPTGSQAAGQRSELSIQIQSYLNQMKVLTATPWSVDANYDLVGRPESQEMIWRGISENMTIAIMAAGPADIDQKIVDDLVDQACEPWSWENSQIHLALAHIGRRAITKYIDVIEATPVGENRA